MHRLGADALRRRVATAGRLDLVDLLQLGVVGAVPAKELLDGHRIELVAVGGDLDAASHATSYVGHNRAGSCHVTATDVPGDHQLRVGINCRPRPHVAHTFDLPLCRGDVLGL